MGEAESLGANGSLRLIASNGFLVYRLVATGAESPLQLVCPVEEHDALVSGRCEAAGGCRAVVAAAGSLWECSGGGEEAPAQPLAALPRSYKRPADSPLVHWAVAGPKLQVLFAAPRRGPIVELRRQGGELRPVAELQLDPSTPAVEEWLSLATARSGGEGDADSEDVLLAVAAPGPSVVAWSLASGRHLGTWPLRDSEAGAGNFADGSVGWCATESGSLYSASATQDGELGGIALSRWPVPRMS